MLTKSMVFKASDSRKYSCKNAELWHSQDLHTLKICIYAVVANKIVGITLTHK